MSSLRKNKENFTNLNFARLIAYAIFMFGRFAVAETLPSPFEKLSTVQADGHWVEVKDTETFRFPDNIKNVQVNLSQDGTQLRVKFDRAKEPNLHCQVLNPAITNLDLAVVKNKNPGNALFALSSTINYYIPLQHHVVNNFTTCLIPAVVLEPATEGAYQRQLRGAAIIDHGPLDNDLLISEINNNPLGFGFTHSYRFPTGRILFSYTYQGSEPKTLNFLTEDGKIFRWSSFLTNDGHSEGLYEMDALIYPDNYVPVQERKLDASEEKVGRWWKN